MGSGTDDRLATVVLFNGHVIQFARNGLESLPNLLWLDLSVWHMFVTRQHEVPHCDVFDVAQTLRRMDLRAGDEADVVLRNRACQSDQRRIELVEYFVCYLGIDEPWQSLAKLVDDPSHLGCLVGGECSSGYGQVCTCGDGGRGEERRIDGDLLDNFVQYESCDPPQRFSIDFVNQVD